MQARKDISAFLGIMASVAAIAAAMTSCVRETFEMTMPEEGRKVTVTLPLASPGVMETVVTKANTYSNMASIILFIYNADGTVCEKILETENGDITLEGGSEYSDDANSGRLYTARFTATSGVKRICAIANYEDVTNWEYYDREAHQWGNFSEYIDRLKTLAREGMNSTDLGKRVFFLSRVFPERGNTPTFDGWRMISTGAGNISIDTDGNVTDPAGNGEGILHMERCVADIQFRITSKAADNPETQDVDESSHIVSFRPTSYSIYNIPSGLRLAPGRTFDDNPNEGERPDESFPEFYYDGSDKTRFEEVTDEATSTTWTTIQFFMPENIQQTLTTGMKDGEQYDFTTADNSGYQLRERWSGTDGDEKKIWKFAPENSTYVVITGEYSESDADNNHLYSGTVSYTVHLGNFGPGRWGDFSIRRNNRYIYTVTVSGVNNIKVEATTDNETQPGAEGSVISTQDNVTRNYSLDAHFEQVFLEYNLTEIAAAANTLSKTQGISITEAIARQMMLSIESPFHSIAELTPYSTYMEYISQGYNETDALAEAKRHDLMSETGYRVDYKWVEFWPQTVSGTALASYPGLPAWKNGSNSTNDSQYLLDVYDVCVKMGKAVHKLINGENLTEGARGEDGISIFRSDNGSYYARFTGFVDEYYYTANPLDGSAISWNSFVNKPQRRMIISMDARTSADGNSTYSTGHTNISQRSIQTFYNAGTDTPLNGIGLETFNETRPCPYGTPEGPGNNTSASDGRSNTMSLLTTRDQVIVDYERKWVQDGVFPWDGHYEYIPIYGWGDPYLPDWNYFINDADNGYKESMTGAENERYRTDGTYSQGVEAYYACLSRNRDENGDGKIDDSEVRWYLPALNEYLRIGMGAIAMSNECALMQSEDKATMTKSGYPLNYLDKGVLYRTSTSGREVYWAAEKGAFGNGYETDNIPIRCIRSLPGNVEDLNALADPICDFYNLDDGTRLIDFRDKVVNDLYRDTPTWSAFIEHNEDDLQNRFYDGLVVASRDNGTHRLRDILNIDNNKENPCEDYYEGNNPNDAVNGRGRWRVPNLAEFTVMTTDPARFFGSSYNSRTYFCSTRFSNSNTRLAFRFNQGLLNCLGGDNESLDVNQNTWGTVRCVRDATSSDFNRIP